MNKIKETITALTTGEFPSAVQIQRQEDVPMTECQFEMVLKCIVKISAMAAGTALILFAGFWKLVAIFVFIIFFCLIYYGMKD